MRGSAVVLLLAFASACAAQVGNGSSTAALTAVQTFGHCPIGIEARQQPRNAYLLADNAHTAHPSYQVTFHPRTGQAIQQVVLALSGPTGLHLRNATTMSNRTDKADATETVTLDGIADSTVTPTKLTALASISLVSVTYTDGSRWHNSATNSCTIAPSGFVLVN
ncbi:MAG TPA: hypothetical protein VIM67_11195 [Terriglobus sp.]